MVTRGEWSGSCSRPRYAPAAPGGGGRARGRGRRADDAVALAALALTRDAQQGDEDPFAVLHGLYWLTADIAQHAPLLLAVDDLHWADQPSQRFVGVRRLSFFLRPANPCSRPATGTAVRPAPKKSLYPRSAPPYLASTEQV